METPSQLEFNQVFSEFFPVVSDRPLRFSVGVYRGRKRVVLAYFETFEDALDFAKGRRTDHPLFKYDITQVLF